MKILFAGDSWAAKGYTEDNYHLTPDDILPTDTRLADYWPVEYQLCLGVGRGNLYTLQRIVEMNIPAAQPIVWVYTEPGRDYGTVTGDAELAWLAREDYFEIRPQLNQSVLTRIREQLPNPIALIGGLSDIDVTVAEQLGFTVLAASWQQWIAERVNSQHFKFGWGASDVGWRLHRDNITPSRAVTFAWDEQIKEWCSWAELGYFCHEHPTPRANKEFASDLKPALLKWIKDCEQ